jgi:hypothetical protein
MDEAADLADRRTTAEMGTRTIAVLLLLTLRVVAQAQIEIPKEWRGKTQAELLALPEIGRMPFVAQDQILDALEPGHISIPWAQRRQPLLLAEQGRATAENRKPRSVLVWAKANEDICIDYFTDGEHYYAISLPSLFSVSEDHGVREIRAGLDLRFERQEQSRHL